MAREPDGVLRWDLKKASRALKLTSGEVHEYFTDGRRVSFILERRIAREVLRGRLAESEGAAYDLLDPEGGKWEVRSITQGGIYFCPSYMVGSSRKFDRKGFLRKLATIKGYIVSDVELFPAVPFWTIKAKAVRKWFDAGLLGPSTKISRDKALSLINA